MSTSFKTDPNHRGILARAFVLALALPIFGAPPPASPLSPEEELKTFHLADSRLTIELVAAEPNVLSPVALGWDADGKLYVAEMTDYPNGPISGRIRLLEDRDGDGQYERASIFAETLPFPNGVTPWKNGVLVTAPPDIWYLADTNGDGIADVREKILTGFAEGNQQLRANGLFWGIDNWIYGANGRSDGEIRWANSPASPTVSIRRRDFRFRPDLKEFEAIAGNSQFGMGHDDWGNRFPVFNNIPIRQVVVEDRYFERAAFLAGTENVIPISAPDDTGRVFPLAPPMLLIPQPAGFFTSACGPTIYRGNLLPPEYAGNAFICEAVQNLVQRRVLRPKGAAFLAARAETNEEFLAATDPWFHGVFTATGPDGAFYLVDFYRKYVEHPHWVAKELQTSVPWRTGEAHGRIWRIRAKKSRPSPPPQLSQAPSAQLVEILNHENGWWRDTAQRLLIERSDRSVAPALAQLAQDGKARAVARLHALYTLDGLQMLSLALLTRALGDPDPHLRLHAMRLAEGRFRAADSFATSKLELAFLRLSNDPDPLVRVQFELTASELPPARVLAHLEALSETGAADPWESLAILSGIRQEPALFLKNLRVSWMEHPSAAQFQFLEKIGEAIGAALPSSAVERATSAAGTKPLPVQMAVLSGLARSAGAPQLRKGAGALAEQVAAAGRIASDKNQPDFLRVAAIQLVGQFEPERAGRRLLRWMLPDEPQPVQTAAARALAPLASLELAQEAVSGWTEYTRTTRTQLAASAPSSVPLLTALAKALATRQISALELDQPTRQQFSRVSPPDLRRQFSALFQPKNSDRQAVVEKFRAAATLTGDRQRGAQLFSRICVTCHAVEGLGGHVGPDLTSVASRPKETLLIDILDPSRQVLPDYASYTIDLRGAEPISGVIAAESATTVTVRRPNLPDVSIPRSEIAAIRADAKSPMPEGLEETFDDQQLSDLLEFLQHPSKDLLEKP